MRIDPDATVHVILIQFQNYSATEYISNETIRQSILAALYVPGEYIILILFLTRYIEFKWQVNV